MKNIFFCICIMFLCLGCQKERVSPIPVSYLKESAQTGILSNRSIPSKYGWLEFGLLKEQTNVLLCMLAKKNSKNKLVWGRWYVLYKSELLSKAVNDNCAKMMAWTNIGQDTDRNQYGPWIDLSYQNGVLKLRGVENWMETCFDMSDLPAYRTVRLPSFPEDVAGVRLLQLRIHSIKTCDPSEDGNIKVTAGGEMPFCYAMDLLKTRKGEEYLSGKGFLLADVNVYFQPI